MGRQPTSTGVWKHTDRGNTSAAGGPQNITIAELPRVADEFCIRLWAVLQLVRPILNGIQFRFPIIESYGKRLRNVPNHTLLEPRIFRKSSMATCPAETMTALCPLHAYEKMLDLSSVCSSFGLQ